MKPTVLILDDEPAIGSSLRFALETNYEVTNLTEVPEAYQFYAVSLSTLFCWIGDSANIMGLKC